jgi:hypothetical protein
MCTRSETKSTLIVLVGLQGSGKTTAARILSRTKGIQPLIVRSMLQVLPQARTTIRILRPIKLDGIVSYIAVPSTTREGETAAIVADFTVHNGSDDISLAIILHSILGCIRRKKVA